MWIQNSANYNILDTFQYKQGYPGPIFKVKFKIKTITNKMELSHFQTFDVSLGRHVGEVYVKGTEVVIPFSSGYVDSTLSNSLRYHLN